MANPSGEWKAETGGAGGFNATETFKNYQYSFEIAAANTLITIGLTSPDVNVQYALFDPLGQQKATSVVGRDAGDAYTLNAGVYRVVVMADRQAVGRFTMSLSETKAGATRIGAQMLQSGTQDWGLLGGGGNVVTYKNHFYTLDITDDNTSIDVEFESADTDIGITLFDALGSRIYARSGGRYQYTIQAVKKGTYRVMAATNQRGEVGKYNLRVTGKVQNLTRVDSQVSTTVGAWTASSKVDQYGYAYDEYMLQLTADSNVLDLEISSADTFVELYLDSVNGVSISNDVQSFLNNRSKTTIRGSLPKGLYKITARASRGRLGTYTLNTVGQFTDFKKL